MIAFRVGPKDTEFLAKEFGSEFDAHDLMNLPNYDICIRLMIDGANSRPFSARTIEPTERGSTPNRVVGSDGTTVTASSEIATNCTEPQTITARS